MENIIYFASEASLKPMSALKRASYRKWAKEQIQNQFPNASVTILQELPHGVNMTSNPENDKEVHAFCINLFSRRPARFQ